MYFIYTSFNPILPTSSDAKPDWSCDSNQNSNRVPTITEFLPSFFFYLVFADLISESVSFIGRRRCFFLLGLRRLFFFRLVSRSRSDWIELMFLLCAGRYLFIFFKSLGFLFLFLPMETELDVPFYPQSDRVVCVCVR